MPLIRRHKTMVVLLNHWSYLILLVIVKPDNNMCLTTTSGFHHIMCLSFFSRFITNIFYVLFSVPFPWAIIPLDLYFLILLLLLTNTNRETSFMCIRFVNFSTYVSVSKTIPTLGFKCSLQFVLTVSLVQETYRSEKFYDQQTRHH
jgi:hypothetical protein